MKNAKILAFLLAMLMLLGMLASCNNKEEPQETETSGLIESTTDLQETEPNDEVDDETEDVISMTGTTATAGLEGNIEAIWKKESGEENVVTGTAQGGVPYAVYAAMASPTVVTKVIFTAPTEDQILMAGATVDGSVDGVNWVTLTTIGNTVVSGKTYSINIKDTAQYLYIRVRQADSSRNQAFRLRTIVIMGYAKEGIGGDISSITPETDTSKLISMTSYVASSTKSGDYTNVFMDNENSWVASKSTSGTPNFLMTTMTKKTEIRKVVVKLWGSNRQARGTAVQASVDGGTWVELCKIPDLMQGGVVAETGEYTFYVEDATQYSFIRLVQRSDLASYDWSLNTVLVYGVESEEDAESLPRKYVDAKWVYVQYHSSFVEYKSGVAVENSVWDTSNIATTFTHKNHPDLTERVEYWISGKLVGPTVITEITYFAPDAYATRARTSYFEGSVDGITWIRLATLPGAIAAGEVIKLGVNDDTAYNYVRMVQGEGFYKEYWTVGTAAITGVCDTPNPTDAVEPKLPNTIAVTAKSATSNLHDNQGDPIMWEKVWEPANETRLVCRQKEAIEIVGEFGQATEIEKVTFKVGYYPARASLFKLSASVDGETWVELKDFADVITAQNAAYDVISFDVEDDTEYRYVRLSIDATDVEYWAELYYISFYGAEA